MNQITLTADCCRWSELTPRLQLEIMNFINHAASWPGADHQIRQELSELCRRSYFDDSEEE